MFVAPYPDPLAADQDAAVAEALKGFDHLLKSMTAPDETAAVILEPVLGEGGYTPAPQAFMTGLVVWLLVAGQDSRIAAAARIPLDDDEAPHE